MNRYWLRERKYWWWDRPKEKLILWAVWKLPRGLVYQSAIRVIANATTGQWKNQIVPELTAMDALDRWEKSGGR
jgi:hypothetical protein